MQLLMRRGTRREKRQMYYDAHSAFNVGDGGGKGRRCKGGRQGIYKKQTIPIGHTGNGALLELHDVAG